MKALNDKKGMALLYVVVVIVILSLLGLGVLTISYGVRFNATKIQSEAVAMLAAEAGYEEAVFWMGQQSDMVYVMKTGGSYSNSLAFANSGCNYQVSFFSFIGSRPTYRIISNGYSGRFKRTVDVLVVQAIGGWDMGMCRIPSASSSTSPVYFADGEVIDMPIHINKANDSPDSRDIFVTGNPQFLETVSMGESRYTSGGADKYSDVMGVFDAGIDFDQPNSKITDEAVVQKKIDRFKDSTEGAFTFKPVAKAAVPYPVPAVQLEFFVQGGVGNIRVTNNCTVRGFMQASDSRTWDFMVKPGTTDQYARYNIYAYHFMPQNADATGERVTQDIQNTYVTQSIGGVESEPGGQIFVDGNVIIGGNNILYNNGQVVKGKITIVATGNIWVADSVVLDGAHDADGMPSKDNPNALGLIAQGVVKVVDPGMTEYSYVDGQPLTPADSVYVPIGVPDVGQPVDSYKRHLPDQMAVEASVTVGGGGWGAENVQRSPYGGRKEFSGTQDDLIVRGTITEVIRGIVGQIGADGFLKHYYFDRRFLEGILPGDVWLQGKYIPAPGGWSDYETVE